jgi:Fe-S-cluster containining protein
MAKLSNRQKSELCIKCQECCKFIPISIPRQPESEQFNQLVEFFQVHGCKVRVFGDDIVVKIPSQCIHLAQDGCVIYEARPKVCREMDGLKDLAFIDSCLWRKDGKRT